MSIVTLSSRYQVVIPKDVRDTLELEPGQKLMALPYEGRVVLVPLEPPASLHGFMAGAPNDFERDPDRV
ncbi:MAG: AbrB/MazE/SpoVT family DNA-binding domain-containing protein [Longimicrobiales bacterium]